MYLMTTSESDLLNVIPDAAWVVTSPGSINLMGERVDQSGGVLLLAAIDRYVKIAIKPRDDDKVVLHALDSDTSIVFSLQDLDTRQDADGNQLPDWALFPASAAWAFQKEGFHLTGMEAVYSSDLPIGFESAQSAAVELAFAEYWKTIGEWKIDRMRMARVCQYGEHAYAGNQAGLAAQFACAHGVARCVLFFDSCNLSWQPIPLPLNTSIVIVDSTIRSGRIASSNAAYREECQQALALIVRQKLAIKSLSDVRMTDLGWLRSFLPLELMNRVQYLVEESERVKSMCRCLIADDAVGFGRILSSEHTYLRNLNQASFPKLDALVDIAVGIDGCIGARQIDAGYTVNFVNSAQVENFSKRLPEKANQRIGLKPIMYPCSASRSVHIQQISGQAS